MKLGAQFVEKSVWCLDPSQVS